MTKLYEYIEFISGTPQSRITVSQSSEAQTYIFYSQNDLDDDLTGIPSAETSVKQVRTFDNVDTLNTGDIVFSLISGRTSIVSKAHYGYLYTQNYVKLIPQKSISSSFIVYLLNENRSIKKQFQTEMQGTSILKYTLTQLKNLTVPQFPTIEKQKTMGNIYLKQLRLKAIKERAAGLETIILLSKLKKEFPNE